MSRIVESLYRVSGIELKETFNMRDPLTYEEDTYIDEYDEPLSYLVSVYLPKGTKYISCLTETPKVNEATKDIILGRINILDSTRLDKASSLTGYALAKMNNLSLANESIGLSSIVTLDPNKWEKSYAYNNKFICKNDPFFPKAGEPKWSDIVYVKDLNNYKTYTFNDFFYGDNAVARKINKKADSYVKSQLNNKLSNFTEQQYKEIAKSTIDIFIDSVYILFGRYPNIKSTVIYNIELKNIPVSRLSQRNSLEGFIKRSVIKELKVMGGYISPLVVLNDDKTKIRIHSILGDFNSVPEFDRAFTTFYTVKENNKK